MVSAVSFGSPSAAGSASGSPATSFGRGALSSRCDELTTTNPRTTAAAARTDPATV